MLVLERQIWQSIVIKVPGLDEPIRVTVVRDGPKPKLGIEAPKEVVILRDEIAGKAA